MQGISLCLLYWGWNGEKGLVLGNVADCITAYRSFHTLLGAKVSLPKHLLYPGSAPCCPEGLPRGEWGVVIIIHVLQVSLGSTVLDPTLGPHPVSTGNTVRDTLCAHKNWHCRVGVENGGGCRWKGWHCAAHLCPEEPHQNGGSASRKEFIVGTEWGGGAQGSPESHHFKAFWKGVPSPWCQECQPPLGLSMVCLPSGNSRTRLARAEAASAGPGRCHSSWGPTRQGSLSHGNTFSYLLEALKERKRKNTGGAYFVKSTPWWGKRNHVIKKEIPNVQQMPSAFTPGLVSKHRRLT